MNELLLNLNKEYKEIYKCFEQYSKLEIALRKNSLHDTADAFHLVNEKFRRTMLNILDLTEEHILNQ